MMTPREEQTPEVDVEQTLEELLELSATRREVAELSRKVDQLMQLLAARGMELQSTPAVEDTHGKKHSSDEASITETPPAAHLRVSPGATEVEVVRHVKKAKEPSIPLPNEFDGNPRNLRKFLSQLALCFRIAPMRYAADDVKIATAGRLCSHKKVDPWWNTWMSKWDQNEEGFRTWDDFQKGIRSEFKDHLERKDARAKLKRTKQTSKIREYVSSMQSLNLDAGYDDEFL